MENHLIYTGIYDKNFQPLCFTADYEVAEMKAIKKPFNFSIIGDSFHFAQALYRQIKRLGLTTKVNKYMNKQK